MELWWRTTDYSLKLAMAAEVALPGSGTLLRRQYLRSGGRLALGMLLGFGALVLSAVFLPPYFYYGVSGAISLAEEPPEPIGLDQPPSLTYLPPPDDAAEWRPLGPLTT